MVLRLIDENCERTYGNTCCDTTIGKEASEISMDAILSELFVAARGPVTAKATQISKDLNLMHVGSCSADRPFQELKSEITDIIESGGWRVYFIHGVGKGTHRLFIDTEDHDLLVKWLSENKENVWTAPFIEVAKYVRNWLGVPPASE